MFKLHNSVRIDYDGKSVVKGNEILDVKTPLKNKLAFAKHIIFGTKNGKISRESTLVSINANPLSKVMSAEYFAMLNGDEHNGSEFEYFGLSHDGVTLCNRAFFESFVKQEGKSLRVGITIFLEVFDEFSGALVGGDNQFVRFLLGSRALPQMTYFVGGCNYPLRTISRKRELETLKPALSEITQGGFRFVAKDVSPIPNEVIFAIEGLPVFRSFVFDGQLYVYSKSSSVNSLGFIPIGEMNVERVVSCNKEGTLYGGTQVLFVPSKLYRCDGVLDSMGGYNCVIKSDRLSQYLAILGDREIRVFSLDENGVPFERFRALTDADTALKEGAFDVLSNGQVVCYEPSKIRVFNNDGSVFGVFDIACGEQNITVLDGLSLHYGRISNGILSRFRLDSFGFTQLGNDDVGIDARLFSGLSYLGVSSPNYGLYYTISGGQSAQIPYLISLWSRFNNTLKIDFGYGMCVIYVAGGTKYLVPFELDGLAVKLNEAAEVIMFNEFALVSESNSKKLYVLNRSSGNLALVGGQMPLNNIVSGACLGDLIAFKLNEGSVQTMYKNRDLAFAFNPSLKSGDNVSLVMRIIGNSFGSNTVDVGIGVDIE